MTAEEARRRTFQSLSVEIKAFDLKIEEAIREKKNYIIVTSQEISTAMATYIKESGYKIYSTNDYGDGIFWDSYYRISW